MQKSKSQKTLRGVDKEQGKRNKRSNQDLNRRGGGFVAYLLGNLNDRFLQNRGKEKKEKSKEMYICKFKTKNKKKQAKMS